MRVARVYTGVVDTRYLSIELLRRARRNLHFDPPKLGDRPPTGEFTAPLHHTLLLLLQSPSLPTQPWPTGRRSPPSSNIVRPMSLENVLERMPDRPFLETACLNALFVPFLLIRAYLAYLASGKARHVKTTKKTLNNNAVRLELPKLGERRLFFPLFWWSQRTGQSPQLGTCL